MGFLGFAKKVGRGLGQAAKMGRKIGEAVLKGVNVARDISSVVSPLAQGTGLAKYTDVANKMINNVDTGVRSAMQIGNMVAGAAGSLFPRQDMPSNNK